MPCPKVQFFTDTGLPLSGGLVYTYMPGTTTPKATYTDSTGVTANANPVVLDSAGRASIWLSGYYRIDVYTSAGVLVYSVDNVSSMSAALPVTNQWIAQDLALTYASTTQFTVPGNQTASLPAGTRIQATVTAGVITGTVVSSSAGGSPVVTTVNCIWDAGSLDSGLSAISTGIITVTSSSLPILPVSTKTASYVLPITDISKILIMNADTAQDFTLPAANAVPLGAWYRLKNVGAGLVTVVGTVDGSADPTLGQYDEMLVFSDGSAWYRNNRPGANVGDIITRPTGTVPDGYLECDGSSLVRATYPSLFTVLSDDYGAADGIHFNLPDYRGRFLRAWAHGSANDPDRAARTDRGDGTGGDVVGSKQATSNLSHQHDAVGNHTHTYAQQSGANAVTAGGSHAYCNGYNTNADTAGAGGHQHAASGGNESRPLNINVMYCIKY